MHPYTKEQITELCEALGWFSIPSNNPHMISFKREDVSDTRLNIYPSTPTATLQRTGEPIKTLREFTLEMLEKFLII